MTKHTGKRRDRAGRFTDRIIVYRQDPEQAANEDGEIPESALEVCQRWANIVPQRGRLKDLGASIEPNVSHVIWVPYDSVVADLTSDNWIVIHDTGQRLNIVSAIDPNYAHYEIEIECTERVL
jgi:head-tail adaptor